MRFALVSQDPAHGAQFRINPNEGDATGFMNWVDVWKGYHFSFGKLREDKSILRQFDVVMFSGNPHNFQDIIDICEFLKPYKVVTIFYPEGSAQLYDNTINSFSPIIYEAWNACDIFSVAEEDKLDYYRAFLSSGTIARFIHVPMREEMDAGIFFTPQNLKDKNVALVYGDNNPNHPLIAIAAATSRHLDIVAVDADRGKAAGLQKVFPNTRFAHYPKLGAYPFLALMSRCFVSFYPTEWIGTARHQISCAVTGTPCIGNHDSHTQRRLFPTLGCDIYNVRMMGDYFDRLRKPEYYDQVADYAREQVQFYSLGNTKARFMSAVNEAIKIKESKKVYANQGQTV